MDTTILKLLVVPPFIAGVSLAGRRWGSRISGWLIGLPVNAGVIVFFIALENGNSFAAKTAQGSLLGTISLALFCLAYARLVPLLRRWYRAMTVSWLVFFSSTFSLEAVSVPVFVGFPIVALVLVLVRQAMPTTPPSASDPARDLTRIKFPSWDIPLRILTATALVFSLTVAASPLGPQLSGLLSPFPVYTTILTGFTQHFEGSVAAVRFLRGFIIGLYTFATFFLVLGVSIETLGLAVSFGLSLATCLALHYLLLKVLAILEPW